MICGCRCAPISHAREVEFSILPERRTSAGGGIFNSGTISAGGAGLDAAKKRPTIFDVLTETALHFGRYWPVADIEQCIIDVRFRK
jgi:hypothetical protein